MLYLYVNASVDNDNNNMVQSLLIQEGKSHIFFLNMNPRSAIFYLCRVRHLGFRLQQYMLLTCRISFMMGICYRYMPCLRLIVTCYLGSTELKVSVLYAVKRVLC